jgi:hypothetical protein
MKESIFVNFLLHYYLFSLSKKKRLLLQMIIKDSIHNHYKTKEFEMYTMSEMAGLMEDVCYKICKENCKGEAIGESPNITLKFILPNLLRLINDLFFLKPTLSFILKRKRNILIYKIKKRIATQELMFVLRVMKKNVAVQFLRKLYLK